MNRIGLVLLGLWFLGLTQSSCRVSKGARKTIPVDTLVNSGILESSDVVLEEASGIAGNMALSEVLSTYQKRKMDFQTFSGKAKMHYDGNGERQEFTAHFRLKKDSVIWASFTAIGGIVQVARVVITPDSLKLINYLDKEFIALNLLGEEKIIPASLDFYSLQNLLMGNVLSQEGIPLSAQDNEEALTLEVADAHLVQNICYNRADTTIRTLRMRSLSGEESQGLVQYGNYVSTHDQKFPLSRTLSISFRGVAYNLDMAFSKADFNVPVDFPFTIPKNCKPR